MLKSFCSLTETLIEYKRKHKASKLLFWKENQLTSLVGNNASFFTNGIYNLHGKAIIRTSPFKMMTIFARLSAERVKDQRLQIQSSPIFKILQNEASPTHTHTGTHRRDYHIDCMPIATIQYIASRPERGMRENVKERTSYFWSELSISLVLAIKSATQRRETFRIY